MQKQIPLYLCLLTLCLGCSNGIKTTFSSILTLEEEAFCTISCITNGTCTGSTITIVGHAFYERRELTATDGLGGKDLGGPHADGSFPIRDAEYQVIKNGELFHCGSTGSDGSYSFPVPDDGDAYTLRVNSRSYSADNKVSVLESPHTGRFYSLPITFNASGASPKTVDVPRATYNGEVKGGAFNILDQIYKANLFLKNEVAGFSLSKKLTAYWKLGHNPAVYFGGDADSGLSFYLTNTDSLYILGGIQGDVQNSDTDHFDDSVILHEYGHFIEDNYSASHSPGGSHNGRQVIDPRLAWSEAFATFFMSQVLGTSLYRDSKGYGASSYYMIHYDIGNRLFTYQDGVTTSKMDTPANVDEGGFREFAIVRTLDTIFDGATLSFQDFWNIFTGPFKNTESFVDSGHFFNQLSLALAGLPPAITNILSDPDNYIRPDRQEYGHKKTSVLGAPPNILVSGGGDANCKWEIQAQDQVGDFSDGRDSLIDDGIHPLLSAFGLSNQHKSNDFFLYYHNGVGPLSVQLDYVSTDPSTYEEADLDLYIYKSNYSFGNPKSLLTYSNRSAGIGMNFDNGVESISTLAPAGYYMINIMYWTHRGINRGAPVTNYFDTARYSLRVGGNNYFCK